jgi:hypothetical protein
MKLLILLFCVQTLLASNKTFGLSLYAENKDSLKQGFVDDSLVASFDSAFMSKFFYSEDFFAADLPEIEEVPVFSDSVFAERIEALNKQTPIDLVFNSYVKQYINVYTKKKGAISCRE